MSSGDVSAAGVPVHWNFNLISGLLGFVAQK